VANAGHQRGNRATLGSLTEVDASSGAPVRVFPSSRYGFDTPRALAVVGPDILVANAGYAAGGHSSVTEVNTTTGTLVRTLSVPEYDFDGAFALAQYGNHLFVGNFSGQSLS
jgi:hypothetical protein